MEFELEKVGSWPDKVLHTVLFYSWSFFTSMPLKPRLPGPCMELGFGAHATGKKGILI